MDLRLSACQHTCTHSADTRGSVQAAKVCKLSHLNPPNNELSCKPSKHVPTYLFSAVQSCVSARQHLLHPLWGVRNIYRQVSRSYNTKTWLSVTYQREEWDSRWRAGAGVQAVGGDWWWSETVEAAEAGRQESYPARAASPRATCLREAGHKSLLSTGL